MLVQKLGHSCVLVETLAARVLIDPGSLAHPALDSVSGLSAILITHQHRDHADPARLQRLVEQSPHVQVVADQETANWIRDAAGLSPVVVRNGEVIDLGVQVAAVVGQHAEIHPEMPRVSNVGYLLDSKLFHPGDALDYAPEGVAVLALPTMGPWMKLKDAVDYLRAVAPATAFPIHEGLLRDTKTYYRAFDSLASSRTRVRVLDDGTAVEL